MYSEFFSSLYPTLFYQWIAVNRAFYKKDHITFELSYQNQLSRILLFQMKHVIGTIVIWEQNIIEEKIQDQNGDQLFYLHFEITDFKQCTELFKKFYESLLQYNQQKNINIALCCTGGLSTSIFAEEIQKIYQLENKPIIIHSLTIEELKHEGHLYDIVYLAPQVAPLLPQLLLQVNKPLYCIDSSDFATKNYQNIMKTIILDLKKRKLLL